MENDNHITDMQQLADTGWKQMHEMLQQHGLTENTRVSLPAARSRKLFSLAAACVFSILILSFPYILNNKFYSPIGNKAKTATTLSQKQGAVTQSVKMISAVRPPMLFAGGIANLPEKLKVVFIDTKVEKFTIPVQSQREAALQNAACKNISVPASVSFPQLKQDSTKDTVVPASLPKRKNTGSLQAKKVRFFAGAGMNVPIGSKHANTFFNDVNIHPGVTVVIPVSKRLSLHSGLWAFSVVHGKEVSARERELVNNMNGSPYYNINTTSVIKASYFDIPVTLHFSINKNWSAGSGFQLSRLYKINIREQRESYDYNNLLFSATVQQYTSTPARAAVVFQKKVEIKKYEPRFVAETNIKEGKWLFSAGYYYGLGKTITLKETNTNRQYRNEYFKLGIQYRIGAKGD